MSRRTLVAGTAWAVPAVVVAGAAPAAAATPLPTITVTLGNDYLCKYPAMSIYPNGFKVLLDINNRSNPRINIIVTIDSLSLPGGDSATNIDPRAFYVPPRQSSRAIIAYPFNNPDMYTQLTVGYHYDDPVTGQRVDAVAGPFNVINIPYTSCSF